jgi:hypothetical protein
LPTYFRPAVLVVLLAPGGLAGPPSEAAPTTPQAPATIQPGAGSVGQSPTLLGDINNDGIVDIRDYGVWRQNFGQTGPTITPTPAVTPTPGPRLYVANVGNSTVAQVNNVGGTPTVVAAYVPGSAGLSFPFGVALAP